MTKRKQIITPAPQKKDTELKMLHSDVKASRIEHTDGIFYKEPFFKLHWLAVVVIFLLSFGLYFTCISYNYVLDDQMVITDNAYTKKGFSGIWDILTTESFQGYFGAKKELVQGNRYRPLSIITFAMEYGILGKLNPSFIHIINMLLYAFTGVILMMVLNMMFRNFKTVSWWMSIPFLAAIIYIVHPIHTEAVANIKGRDEIMSMLFSFIALYAGLRFMDHKQKTWLGFSMVAYLLGLLSKENAITFLGVIPLTVYFFSDTDWRRLRTLFLWLTATTVIYLLLRFNTAGVPKFGQEINDVMNNPFLGMTAIEKIGSIMYTLGKYVALMFWPHPLSHDYYPYAIPKASLFTLIPLLSSVLYITLLFTGFRGWVKKSVYSYSILYYLVTLTIVSNIVINLGTFMNERFIFMASAGFCIAAAYFISVHLPRLLPSGGSLASMILLIAVVTGFGAKTYVRVPVWKDALSLNEAAVAVSSNSARANSFMSTALFEKYRITKPADEKRKLLDQAAFYGQKAVKILPEYQNANLMLIGVASERYKMDNNINEYIKMMKPCIMRRPDISFIKEFSDYLKGRGHDEQLFPFYVSIGNELLTLNDRRRDFAIQYLTYAYEIHPDNRQVNEALGLAYDLKGDAGQAQKFKSAAQSMQ